jgi:hypothetical protein
MMMNILDTHSIKKTRRLELRTSHKGVCRYTRTLELRTSHKGVCRYTSNNFAILLSIAMSNRWMLNVY